MKSKYRNWKNVGVSIALVFSMFLMAVGASGVGGSETLSASSSITATECIMSLSGSSLTFVNSVPGVQSLAAENPITVTNTGNFAGTLFASATNWTSGSNQVSASATAYALSNVTPSIGLSLISTEVGTITNSTPIQMWFGFTAPVDTPAGAYSQTITLSTSC